MATTTRTETVTSAVIHILPNDEARVPTQDVVINSEQPKQVSWGGDTLDNENLGRKSSKVCCIYHKRRAFAESSSESSSNSDTDDGEGAKKALRQRKSSTSKKKICRKDGQTSRCFNSPDVSQLSRQPLAAPKDQK